MQFYTDPQRETHVSPDAESFYIGLGNRHEYTECFAEGMPQPIEHGWYWWACFPGCLPDGEPIGPFATEDLAVANARETN